MPELPEVETIKRHLEKQIINKKILSVEIKNKKSFHGSFAVILGKKIKQIQRKGKILIINLDKDYDLLIHLKMSGQLFFLNKKSFNNFDLKFTRVIFYLSQGLLIFNDIRKFGWIKVIKKNNLEKNLKSLGRDAQKITFEEFKGLLKSSQQNIKLFLIDQKKIAGIGNIYASEILYLAKINPLRKTHNLSDQEIKNLYQALKKILKKAIRYGGTSMKNYFKPDSTLGKYQHQFLVYSRENQTCQRCGQKIKRMKINNRSTFYCPFCQKL